MRIHYSFFDFSNVCFVGLGNLTPFCTRSNDLSVNCFTLLSKLFSVESDVKKSRNYLKTKNVQELLGSAELSRINFRPLHIKAASVKK